MNNKVKQNKRNNVEGLAVSQLNCTFYKCEQITPDIKINDKEEGTDGYLKLTNTNGEKIGTLEVQVKGLTKIPKKLTYSVSKNFLELCKRNTLPIILFVVYVNEDRAYWVHMDKSKCNEYLTLIIKKDSNSLSIPLDENNYLSKDDNKTSIKLIEQLTNIVTNMNIKLDNYEIIEKRLIDAEKLNAEIDKYSDVLIGKSDEIYKDIHIFLDYYNNLLDRDFKAIKEYLYPHCWKVGIGIYNFTNKTLGYVLYPISFDSNDVQIKKINKDYRDMEQLWREYNAIKMRSHFAENDILTRPEQYAYELIGDDLFATIGDIKINFLVKDFYLANEVIFDFIAKCHIPLNLDPNKDRYYLPEIEALFNNCYTQLMVYLIRYPSIEKTLNFNFIKELIQYLKNANIDSITRSDYYKFPEINSKSIIETLRRFYEILPKIYDLVIDTYFPNLFDELKFFSDSIDYDLMLVTFDFSARSRAYNGLGIEIRHYFKASLSPGVKKSILINDNITDAEQLLNFQSPIKIEGAEYKLIQYHSIPIELTQTPLLTAIQKLLQTRLKAYLKKKIKSGIIYNMY